MTKCSLMVHSFSSLQHFVQQGHSLHWSCVFLTFLSFWVLRKKTIRISPSVFSMHPRKKPKKEQNHDVKSPMFKSRHATCSTAACCQHWQCHNHVSFPNATTLDPFWKHWHCVHLGSSHCCWHLAFVANVLGVILWPGSLLMMPKELRVSKCTLNCTPTQGRVSKLSPHLGQSFEHEQNVSEFFHVEWLSPRTLPWFAGEFKTLPWSLILPQCRGSSLKHSLVWMSNAPVIWIYKAHLVIIRHLLCWGSGCLHYNNNYCLHSILTCSTVLLAS